MKTSSVRPERLTTAENTGSLAGGTAVLIYGVISYAAFLAAFLYAIGFVGNWVVPKSIDSGPVVPMTGALLINTLLLLGFVVQHTIMARPAFKRWWTQFVPASVERSTFVLLASAALGLLFWQWRPMPDRVWSVDGLAGTLLAAISLAGWAIVLISSFTISHLDLFGLRQTWLRFSNRPYKPVGFRLAGFYRIVRHPLMLGFLIAFWATPIMSQGHLFFAIMTSGYILFGTWIEERDLMAQHPAEYAAYRQQVRGLLPLPRRQATAKAQ